jgi:methyltransferase (TIGR00027 family)
VVILGAGYDSRAYRLAELHRVRVFEVDHPSTQSVKRQVIDRQLGAVPPHVTLVGVDFDQEPLAPPLAAAGLDAQRQTFTIWEGVASYLTPEAVDSTVRWASEISHPGSGLVFTYVHRGLIDGTRDFPHASAWVRSVERAGEPFVYGFEPSELGNYLADRGWELVDDLATPEALAQYGLPVKRVPSFYRIAHAVRAHSP